ncbi:hypothetical protein AVEN_214332-1 [Araneus ventricosus]|uniref:Uncharacterized protein n=1 Tax=Araneus ventricosus TaxID=182803 RepID=A0A4Y2SIX4_ARAVE|nr:hypothetical protein AVEN_214332-1 [Araneus ventricosus]
MKSFDLKYERKQETAEEKVKNVKLIEESDNEDFALLNKKMEAANIEELIYLESPMVNSSTNMFALIDNVGGARLKAHYSYVCGFQEVEGDEYDMICLRTTNLTESKFVSVVNGQIAISKIHLIELVGFQVM